MIMKLSFHCAVRRTPAFLIFALASLVLVVAFTPPANACQSCGLVFVPGYGYIWTCYPALGAGHVACYHDLYGYFCQETGDPCVGGGPGCFLAGTMISTPDGNRPIESLREGDAIWCVSDDGRKVAGKVEATLRHVSDGYCRLNGSTLVTGDHRFLVAGMGRNVVAGLGSENYETHALGQWIPLKNLDVGQQLLRIDGTQETVETIDNVDRGVRVYNLEVSPYHNYFANGILVHNKKPDPNNP
jgi:hypothetical protein